jgi:aspartyl protease family protein
MLFPVQAGKTGMWRYIFMAVSVISFASYGPAMLQEKLGAQGQVEASPVKDTSLAKAEPKQQADNPSQGRSTRIAADARGHFIAKARLNGRPVDVLVDTGATLVAINESTARRIGLKLSATDFKYKVNTANGQTMAAAANIGEIEIGRVIAHDVQASVLKDSALEGILLGMSFLNKLKRVEVAGGQLVLTQ